MIFVDNPTSPELDNTTKHTHKSNNLEAILLVQWLEYHQQIPVRFLGVIQLHPHCVRVDSVHWKNKIYPDLIDIKTKVLWNCSRLTATILRWSQWCYSRAFTVITCYTVSANIYLFKINNRNTKKMLGNMFKVNDKRYVSIVSTEHILYPFPVFLLLTSNKYVCWVVLSLSKMNIILFCFTENS